MSIIIFESNFKNLRNSSIKFKSCSNFEFFNRVEFELDSVICIDPITPLVLINKYFNFFFTS